MTEETRVIQVNGKYRIVIEKAAGVKTGDGFKVEANGDDMLAVETDAACLYDKAKNLVYPTTITLEEKK